MAFCTKNSFHLEGMLERNDFFHFVFLFLQGTCVTRTNVIYTLLSNPAVEDPIAQMAVVFIVNLLAELNFYWQVMEVIIWPLHRNL